MTPALNSQWRVARSGPRRGILAKRVGNEWAFELAGIPLADAQYACLPRNEGGMRPARSRDER
jgi:hypothetical protein